MAPALIYRQVYRTGFGCTETRTSQRHIRWTWRQRPGFVRTSTSAQVKPIGRHAVAEAAQATKAAPDPCSNQEEGQLDNDFTGTADHDTNDDHDSGGDEHSAEQDIEDGLSVAQSLLPPPTKVTVTAGRYLTSCVRYCDCPKPTLPEFAVIGRSNVGKSSLINMLTGLKHLALTSKEPGKTKCINHFIINDNWFFVDLPGYGFARTGRQARERFESFTKEYFIERPNLVMVLLLVDASIPPQAVDLQYALWLASNSIPFSLVFTKADKRRRKAERPGVNAGAFQAELTARLGGAAPPFIMTSANDGRGKRPLLRFIASLRVAFERSGRLAAIAMEAARAATTGALVTAAGGSSAKVLPPSPSTPADPRKAAIRKKKTAAALSGLGKPKRVRPPRATRPNADDEEEQEELGLGWAAVGRQLASSAGGAGSRCHTER